MSDKPKGIVLQFPSKSKEPLEFPKPGLTVSNATVDLDEMYYQIGKHFDNAALYDAMLDLGFESQFFKLAKFRASMMTVYDQPEYYAPFQAPDYIYKIVMYIDPEMSVSGPVLDIKFYGRGDKKVKSKAFPYFPVGAWKEDIPEAPDCFSEALKCIREYHHVAREKAPIQVSQSDDGLTVTFTFLEYENTKIVFELGEEEQDDETA